MTALALVAVLGAVACSGEDATSPPLTSTMSTDLDGQHGGSDVTTNPVATETGPGIDRFEAPATVSCEGPTAQVELTWEAPAAEVVRFLVDGDDLGGDQPPSGTATVDVPCDASIHVVILAAVGSDGATSVRSEAVMAEPAG